MSAAPAVTDPSIGTALSGYATEINNPALPGQPGYGWKYYSDGTSISPDGKYYAAGSSTTPAYDAQAGNLSGIGQFLTSLGLSPSTAASLADKICKPPPV
jgi:hypothetical protein